MDTDTHMICSRDLWDGCRCFGAKSPVEKLADLLDMWLAHPVIFPAGELSLVQYVQQVGNLLAAAESRESKSQRERGTRGVLFTTVVLFPLIIFDCAAEQ